MKVLMVLTSHDQLGNTGEKTGFWLEEFASPYYVFKDAGVDVTVASPKGGQPPIDPKSDDPANQTDSQNRFKADAQAQTVLANTQRLDGVSAADYDAVFYPGGHGPMWDLAEDATSIKLIENFYTTGKPVAAVCHAPAVLRHVEIDGQPIVKGKRVTGFANTEEEAVHLDERRAVPGRRRTQAARRQVREGRRLGQPGRRGWSPDHRPEPGFIGGNGEGAAGRVALNGGFGRLRTVVQLERACVCATLIQLIVPVKALSQGS